MVICESFLVVHSGAEVKVWLKSLSIQLKRSIAFIDCDVWKVNKEYE